MNRDEEDPYDDVEYAFELLPSDKDDNSITLICHPSRKLSVDEYIEALTEFLSKFSVAHMMEEERGPGEFLN